MKANEKFLPYDTLVADLSALQTALQGSVTSDIITKIGNLVPDYVRTGTTVDWVHLRQSERGRFSQVEASPSTDTEFPEMDAAD